MSAENGRTRVAVLGGGPAALAAAFELTATPELRERYEVTVHQLGWRLGGKCASGRNARYGQRIEEHGLHIWFGFYDNAFSLIQRCYEELGRPADAPLATWTDALEPNDDCVQYESFDGQWVPHHFHLPPNGFTPGEPAEIGLWDVIGSGLRFLVDEAARVRPKRPAPHVLNLARRASERRASREHTRPRADLLWVRMVAELVGVTRTWLWRLVVSKQVRDTDLRMLYMSLDLGAAILRGISRDRLVQRGFGAINDEDFRSWLRRHGASELTVNGSPLVRAVYDAAFCFEQGDRSRPNVAAGKAVQDFIRGAFLYKGALFYKMQAGMGDTVFGPLYEVLRARGVRFEFFHCVTRLGVGEDGRSIDEIEVVPQAEVIAPGGEYQPLVDVRGLPCWPSEPDWSQLKDGDALAARGVDFEHDANPLARQPITLRRGADFDEVVLGIPVGALPEICGELAQANGRFARMLDNAHVVMTQAFQLWTNCDTARLGAAFPSGTLASCYVEPMDTYCDMSQLLEREDWDTPVGCVAYFCGVLPDELAPTQSEGDAHVRRAALEYVRESLPAIWPGFDWSLVVDGDGREGEARFDSQYWRANFSGSERYALTLAGSVKHRLWPGESGFQNLVLAGDWTRNGIDGGSVEAAVTSGMLAARAICGSPADVGGTRGWLESDRGDVTA